MSAICRDNVGGTKIDVRARASHMGSQQNYYLAVSHAHAPWMTAIRFVGQNEEQAMRSFDCSRENALAAQAMENWWMGS